MHGDKRSATGVVTESEVQAKLRNGSSPALAPAEERLMRMRVGAGVPLSARLERIAVATDAEIEILAYEIEAYLALKERGLARRGGSAAGRPAPSRTKEKIVRALRNMR